MHNRIVLSSLKNSIG